MRNYSYNIRLTPPRPGSYHHSRPHDLKNAEQDLPQSVFVPDSLDLTAPGRRVLLRHQRVLLAPPTPPPTARQTSEYGGEKEGGKECSHSGNKMSAKIERMRDRWAGKYFKQRVSPGAFPCAWLLFLIIIGCAAGAVVVGWYGLTIETLNHQAYTSVPTPYPMTREPAPPNLQAGAFAMTTDVSKPTAPPGFASPTTTTDLTPPTRATSTAPDLELLRGRQEQSQPVATNPADGNTAGAMGTGPVDYAGTGTTWVVVTPPPTSIPSFTVVTTSYKPSMWNTATVSREDELDYCPHPERPNVWTLCEPTPTSTAPSNTDIASAAAPRMWNPFSAIRQALAHMCGPAGRPPKLTTVRLFRDWNCGSKNAYGCGSDKLVNGKLRAALDLVEVQQRLLESQGVLLAQHRRSLAAAVGLLAKITNTTMATSKM
ncbi:hypothetical protein AAE478_005816 [Parahypoxylon ruwenzoriense]